MSERGALSPLPQDEEPQENADGDLGEPQPKRQRAEDSGLTERGPLQAASGISRGEQNGISRHPATISTISFSRFSLQRDVSFGESKAAVGRVPANEAEQGSGEARNKRLHKPLAATLCGPVGLHGSSGTEQEGGLMRLDDFIKLTQVGQGAYGDVWLAEDIKRKRLVALKKLKLNEEREGFPKNAIREISLLRLLRHRNVVDLLGTIYSRPKKDSLRSNSAKEERPLLPESGTTAPHTETTSSVRSAGTQLGGDLGGAAFPIEVTRQPVTSLGSSQRSSVWMVFEYLPYDLNGIVEQLREQGSQFSVAEVKVILSDVLQALNFAHSRNVIHRDLKSANLLIDAEGKIKLADFGLARSFLAAAAPMTSRVVTLWYRPPELLLGSEWYTPSVDIWSAGCIMAELLLNRAIFDSDNEARVLRAIAETLGPPSDREWAERRHLPLWNSPEANPLLFLPSDVDSFTSVLYGTAPIATYDGTTAYSAASAGEASMSPNHMKDVATPQNQRPRKNVSLSPKAESLWAELSTRVGPLGLDLLKAMLRYNPRDRITAREALQHGWFSFDCLLKGISLRRFRGDSCHAYALRRERERAREAQKAAAAAALAAASGGSSSISAPTANAAPQAQASALSTMAAARRQGPRIVCNTEYIEKSRRNIISRENTSAPG